jgi:predicted metalloprotease with PDZ domain
MNKYNLTIVLVFFIALTHAQKIRYEFSCPNAVHHEAEISVTAYGINIAKPAVFKMSRSSPGRYATHEFGKNVYNVQAFDAGGKNITVNRIDGDVYEVPKHNGTVKISYTLYGNYADGTYPGIDATNLHLNMPATFMWLAGADKAPIEITFNLPVANNWKIATQLKPANSSNIFTAPGLQYFMDSPTKIGDLHFRNWEVTNKNNKKLNFRIALETDASDSLIDAFTQKVQRIVQDAKEVFTEFPAYDNNLYTFIVSVNPYVKGDGMEHRNSTMIALPFEGKYLEEELEVFAHEFFHCWNVERIRPKTIEPFNFTKSNMSNELWVAEGFTQYYGTLLLVRSGLLADTSYILQTIDNLVYTKLNTPGAKNYTPVQASNHAVFVDAGVAVDKTNYPNMYTSYYPYGAAIALALDMELRNNFNSSLDEVMQLMWKKFGKPEIPYTVADLQQAVAETTKNKNFAASFFNSYVYASNPVDYNKLLANAGIEVKPEAPGTAWMGGRFANEDNMVKLTANTIKNTPLYNAGIDIDDVIIQFDGKAITKHEEIKPILNAHKPGDNIIVIYKHHGKEKQATITLIETPYFAVVPYEKDGKELTPAIIAFRKAWLGSKAK